MESKWLASMRTFMSKINANLELDITGVPPTQHINDSHIMDMILESEQFTATQIRRLNYCRLFLQAVTVSDLTNATGQQLDPAKLCGFPDFQSSTTT
jgi:hypothetical protein